MKKDEKKIEELYNALKDAAFVLCFNAAGDEDWPCQYAWTDDDGIPECIMKPDFEHYFDCHYRKYIEVLNKYRKQGNE